MRHRRTSRPCLLSPPLPPSFTTGHFICERHVCNEEAEEMATARDALWASGHDESVEVNQRALIDKVLARYSEEFTVFRELLQNSDDASAKAVEIHFDTEEYVQRTKEGDKGGEGSEGQSVTPLPDLKKVVVHQWTFKNDGMIFRDEDWNRLKKIAEGNPDEEKIGAFGVGFYSLFSVTEEPFVTSGGQWMGFYWKDKKDQLFARRGNIPASEDQGEDRWTTFTMPLRKPETLPIPFDFIRFLTSSITFMAHLSEVSVFLDGKRLARLRKSRGLPKSIGLRKGLKAETAKGMMRVTDVNVMPLIIRAEIMQWVYASGSSVKPRRRVQTAAQQQARKAVSSGFFSSLFSSFSTPQRGASPHPEHIIEEQDEKEQETEERKKLLSVTETSVVLAVFSASVDVRLDSNLREELLRATKKNAPTKMRYELIYTGKDEYEASKKEEEGFEATGSIFQGLRADIDGTGSARIFIGHATRQTTGIGGHMSARFIPTVERESVDLVDRNVRIWNEELLGVGGYLARTAYEEEMQNIAERWQAAEEGLSKTDEIASVVYEVKTQLRERALHALKFYTFHSSTPSSRLSQILEEAFFTCISQSALAFLGGQSNHQFPIISTVGVKGAQDVRMSNPTFAEFLKQLPVLPDDVVTGAAVMVEALRTRGMIKDITFGDVLKELKARPLPENEGIACLKWWASMYKTLSAAHVHAARKEILEATILTIGTPGSAEEKIIPLSSVQTFLNTRSHGSAIPTDGPLPTRLLPLSISRHFDPQALQSAFGWRELGIGEWLQFILDPQTTASHVEHDIVQCAPWAERVIQSLSRVWPSLSKDAQVDIVAQLRDKVCIPTSAGLRAPGDAYFQNAHVFPDLPLVAFPSGIAIKGSLEKTLQALGVRKHVDLQIVFNRMIKTGDWSIADLTKYLVAVQSTLTKEEIERLRLTPAFLKEKTAQDTSSQNGKPPRFTASDLYEPLDIFRELRLPIIDWGSKSKWRGSSDEAKFLHSLGLRRYPPLDVILCLAASTDEKIRSTALRYFLDNYQTRYPDYQPSSFANLAFVPAMKGTVPYLGKPGEVFASSAWASMGLLVARPTLGADVYAKLGIRDHPPTAMLVSILEKNPPEDFQTAQRWFGAMASRIADFSNKELQTLSQLLIVPIETASTKIDDKGKKAVRLMAPSQCYFKKDAQAQVHSKLFTFVDFGTQANQFLSACGTKHEPTVEEIAQILLENPRRFWALADSSTENYLSELRNIAVNRRLLSSGTITRMKRSPILLGTKRKRRSTKTAVLDFEEEDGWDYDYDLLQPSTVIIADDTNGYQLFGDKIFTCPQEDLLEEFYGELGSRRLSSLVKEHYETTSEIKSTRKAEELRSRILERLPLFLHEHTHAPTRVPFAWLNADRNFIVRVFGSVTVKKSLTYGDLRLQEKQDASAVALREGRGPIQLFLAGNVSVDMFEVSTSMCRLLFAAPKASDALLFMTILSTDLKALRRRGYNVDRILQKQRAEERVAEEAAKERAKQTALVSQPTSQSQASSAPAKPTDTRPGSPLPPSLASTGTETTLMDDATEKGKQRPHSAFLPRLNNWKNKMLGNEQVPGALPIDDHQEPSTSGNNPVLMPPRPSASRPITPGPHITPMRDIETNIDMAIRACKEERGDLLKSRGQMQMIKESLNDSYCDVSGQKDLTLAGDMGGFKVFMAKDVANPKSVMTSKRDSIARFIHVVRPLAEVYELPPTSLHVFYDVSGATIAFNRNASLFLNLRFFEAWHDEDVHKGELSKAYVSWYFTLAHEIAHNLVQPHNAEHEFWFSSLCESRMVAFTRLLTGTS
ncbi:hypothetical protein BDY19DRAFT_975723 [Irpex rosettiformis]|uniref:Uncharacterized protein n=1 Tax=Irpex rosettiformis TaxID=378272 RepID=A0ACB8TP48_9APHY|nr:hypothetical protein BDY19DRAFT_975723 [Irpex rosettiformis]